MFHRVLPAAWVVVGMLVLGLALISALAGPPNQPSLDDIIRANVNPPHDRSVATINAREWNPVV